MKKIYFLLLFPLFLFSNIEVVTYFPLESNILRKITYNEVSIKEINQKYSNQQKTLTNKELSRFSNAQLYLHFGLDEEKRCFNLLKSKNAKIIEVDLSTNVEKIDNNPYIWTDPLLMRDIAKNIYEVVVKYDEDRKDLYKKNYEAFLDEIDDTFLKIKQRLNSCDTNMIYAMDDYWDYFGRRFGIEIVKKDKSIVNILDLSELIKYTRNFNIRKILFIDSVNKNIELSFASNLNIKAVENDIFQSNWQSIEDGLTNNLIK